MEPTVLYAVFGVVAIVTVVATLMGRFFRRGTKPRLTMPGLKEQAKDMSISVIEFANKREAKRPSTEVVLAGGGEHRRDHPDRYVDLFDAGTQAIYERDYLPEIQLLREEFAMRGVREKALEKVYENPERIADLRTISTALLVMAQRLR